jgi:hypothetical protein
MTGYRTHFFCVIAALTVSMQIAQAQEAGQPAQPEYSTSEVQALSDWAVGATGGTLGIGGDVSYRVSPYLAARVEATWLELNPSTFLSSFKGTNGYDFTLSQFAVGALVDLHPFRNGFRIVGGIEYADFSFKQSVSRQSSFSINNVNYSSAQIGTLYTNVSIKNSAAPYVGVGWDSAFYCGIIQDPKQAMTCDRFTFSFDLGALYTGGVKVLQTTSATVPGLASNLAAESSSLQSNFNKFYSFYPVAMATLKYRF